VWKPSPASSPATRTRWSPARRNKDLKDGWEGVTEAPLFGHGTGCASSHWQPHNQWVAIWLDIGVGGLLLYAGTLLFLTLRCLLVGGRGIVALAPLWLFSVFSQNLVEMAGYSVLRRRRGKRDDHQPVQAGAATRSRATASAQCSVLSA